MKLQDQVCTLEQAKKLKELGVIQKSIFCLIGGDNPDLQNFTPYYIRLTEDARTSVGSSWYKHRISAFTVAELGVMLPEYYPSWRFKFKDQYKWIATVICSPKPDGIDDIHTAHEFDRIADTQAEALATLLIALLEENVITVEEVNERLTA